MGQIADYFDRQQERCGAAGLRADAPVLWIVA
jgi:hypothetical protein